MSRYLVAHLPAFRLERCGYAASEPAVLVEEVKSATRVVALTPAAWEAGLRPMMTATEARSHCPDVLVEPRDVAGEAHDRAALLESLLRFSDRVFPLPDAEHAGDEVVVLSVGGTAHLFGGESGLITRIRDLLDALGHHARLALADDPLAAAAIAATTDADAIVAPGTSAGALAELPIAALRPSEPLAAALATLGIERVAEWASLDAASVAGRFGAEGTRLHRVARGLVAPDAAVVRWSEVEPVGSNVVLGGPTVTLEPLWFVLPGLLRRLGDALAARGIAAARLTVRLVLERGPARMIRVRLGRPTRDPEVLLRVVRARLENLRLQAPVVELQVEVDDEAEEPAWQLGLVDRTEVEEPIEDLLARLTDALGEGALFTSEPVDDWCPERAWRARPPVVGPARRRAAVRATGRVDPVDAIEAFERALPLPRPSLLLEVPQAIQVDVRGDTPQAVHRERGWEPVLCAEGPEQLCGGWWTTQGSFDRTYWVVRLRDGVGWIFTDHGRWYWHGWFD